MGKVHMGFCPVQKCCSRGVMSELLKALPGACSMCVLHLSHKHELWRGEATGPLHRGEKLCAGEFSDGVKDAWTWLPARDVVHCGAACLWLTLPVMGEQTEMIFAFFVQC